MCLLCSVYLTTAEEPTVNDVLFIVVSFVSGLAVGAVIGAAAAVVKALFTRTR